MFVNPTEKTKKWGANIFGDGNAFVAFQYFTLVLGSFKRPAKIHKLKFLTFQAHFLPFIWKMCELVIQIESNTDQGLARLRHNLSAEVEVGGHNNWNCTAMYDYE